MSISELSFDFVHVQWLVITAIAIYAWVIGRISASGKDVMELRLRLTQIESDMKHMPNRTELQEIEARLERLTSANESLLRELQVTGKQLARINDFLLKTK